MFIFVGSYEKGYFIQDEAEKKGEEVTFIKPSSNIKTQTNEILNTRSCKFLIFDIEQYANDVEEIAEEITRITKVNNAKPIIYASGYKPSMSIVTTLLSYSINNFIFSITLTGKKDQLEKCLNGYYDVNGMDELKEIEIGKVDLQGKEDKNTDFKTIAIAGTMRRIGTTTQALQIVKFLTLQGFRAAYIEMNRTGYTSNLAEYFESEVDDELSKVTIENTDMFFNPDKIAEIIKLEYDYYIYDFGVFEDTDYNKTWYLEKDIKVMVGGIKANEIIKMTEILDNTFYSDVYYLLSFVDKSEEKDVYELMEEKKDHTFFPGYTPNPFCFGNSDIYRKFLNIGDCANAKEYEKRKKFRLFRKRG